MSELIIKSFNHLYRLLRIYLTIAAIGGLSALAYGILSIYPTLPYYVTIILGILFIFKQFVIDYKLASLHLNLVEQNRNTVWNPPKSAEYLLFTLLPKNEAISVIGDFNEQYNRIAERNRHKRTGIYLANLWYWTQVSRSIPSLLMWKYKYRWIMNTPAETTVSFKDNLPFYQNTELSITENFSLDLLRVLGQVVTVASLFGIFFWGLKGLMQRIFSHLLNVPN